MSVREDLLDATSMPIDVRFQAVRDRMFFRGVPNDGEKLPLLFRTEAMTSLIGQLSIIDALITCLAMADYALDHDDRQDIRALSTKPV